MSIYENQFKSTTEKYYSDHPCIQTLMAMPYGKESLYLLDSLYSCAEHRWEGGMLMFKGEPLNLELYSKKPVCNTPGFIRMCFRIFQQAGVLYKNDEDQWCLIDLEHKPAAETSGS